MAGSSRSLLKVSNLFLQSLGKMGEHTQSPRYLLRQRTPNEGPNDGANGANRESQSNQCWPLFQRCNSSQSVKDTIHQAPTSHSRYCLSNNEHS